MGYYKNELFLVKGRYYAWSGQGGYGELEFRGAVEDGVVVDYHASVSKYRCFAPDVILASHDGRWGVLPAVVKGGDSDALYASADGDPFVYDDWVTVRSGERGDDPETCEVFVLLKDGLWKALRVTRVENGICLPEEEGLASETPAALIGKLDEKYGIRLHVLEERAGLAAEAEASGKIDAGEVRPPAEFDVEKDFLSRYSGYLDDPSMYGDRVRLIQMAIGLEMYSIGTDFIYAAAHGDPHAAVLLGRDLYFRLSAISERRESGEETFAEKQLELYDALRDTCLGYLRLGKKYADEKGNMTMGDIAGALYEYADAIPRFKARTAPLGTFPPIPPKKQ